MDDPKKTAESVRSGEYFAEARSWYRAVYLSPIAGRTMFLLISLLAALVAIFAISALTALLPISSKMPLFVTMPVEKTDRAELGVVRLNPNKKDNNDALQEFFAQVFVSASESWRLADAEANAGYVQSHASDAVYQAYLQRMGTSGVGGKLGGASERQVQVTDVRLLHGKDGLGARVYFETAIVSGNSLVEKSQWTAKLKYNYTPLTAEELKGDKKQKSSLMVTDPQFQVTEYAVENR